MAQWTIIDSLYDYSDNEISTSQNEKPLYSIEQKINHFINDRYRGYKDIRLIICDGDSWFDYPNPGLVERLFNEFKDNDESDQNTIFGLVNISNSGDTLAEIVEQSATLESILKKYKNNVKCVLLSAGGNDLISCLDKFLVNDGKDNINIDKLSDVIDLLVKDYHRLIRLILNSAGSENLPIFTHSYSYVCNFGSETCGILKKIFAQCPWIYPHIQKQSLTKKQAENAMRIIFNVFYKRMLEVDNIAIADTRKCMEDGGKCCSDKWIDEIHPKHSTVNNVAISYVAKVKKNIPNLFK